MITATAPTSYSMSTAEHAVVVHATPGDSGTLAAPAAVRLALHCGDDCTRVPLTAAAARRLAEALTAAANVADGDL